MPKIAIIYASGLGRTKKMAEAIANGAMTIEGTEVLLKDAF
jgi:flavodoxin